VKCAIGGPDNLSVNASRSFIFVVFGQCAPSRGADFFTAAFFRAGPVYFFAASFAFAALAARAFFRFAASFAFAAAESFRFALGTSAGAGAAGSDSPLILAHLAFCARAIFRRTAALNFLRFPVGVRAALCRPPILRRPSSVAATAQRVDERRTSKCEIVIHAITEGVHPPQGGRRPTR
jgi:hypothetical protein